MKERGQVVAEGPGMGGSQRSQGQKWRGGGWQRGERRGEEGGGEGGQCGRRLNAIGIEVES